MSTPQQSSATPGGKPGLPWKRILVKAGVAAGGVAVCGGIALGLALALAWPSLPDLHAMTDYRPRVPLTRSRP
jgi:penicillin-binding protein 1A